MVRHGSGSAVSSKCCCPDGHKLWPDWLRRIDTLLEDEAVIEAVAQALEARWPQSRRRAPRSPAEIVLCLLVLTPLRLEP